MIQKDISKLDKYSKIVIIGNEESSLVRHLVNPIKNKYDMTVTSYIRNTVDMAEIDNKIRYKPFFHSKWLIIYSNQDSKAPIKSQLEKILTSTSDNFSCICYVPYRLFKTKLMKEKWVNSEEIGIFNLTYLPLDFYKGIIFSNLKQQIYNPALNLFLKYISRDMHNIMNYIEILNTIPHPITVEDIKINIEDTRVLSMVDYVSNLFQNKEKASIKAMTTLINMYGYKKYKTDLMKALSQIIQIKKIMYDGWIMPETIFDDVFLMKNKGVLPEDLSKLNINIMKNYAISILNIPLKQIILYAFILKAAVDETHLIVLSMLLCNSSKWDADDINYIKNMLEGA